MHFDNPDELYECFHGLEEAGYKRYTPLQDRKVGFTVQREYPEDLSYIPAKKLDGTPDTVALIHVVYEHPEEYKEEASNKVPITLRIGHWSRYWNKHLDYNFEDKDCPTRESVENNKKSRKPIGLTSMREIFFDHNDSLFHQGGIALRGVEVLDLLFETHIRNLRPLRGLPIRVKFGAGNLMQRSADWLSKKLRGALKLVGHQIEENPERFGILTGYQQEDLKKITSIDTLTIFGYKAPKTTISTFGFLIILLSLLSLLWEGLMVYLQAVGQNPLLALGHIIGLLAVLDHAVPVIIFRLINGLIWLRNRLSSLGVPLR